MSKNLFFFFFLLPVFVSAQNLVPNPSFEDTVGCPDNLNQVNKCVGWSSFGGTPDYFSSCISATWVGVPLNFIGFQTPFQGESYCGFITYEFGAPNYREFVGRQLSGPLVIGNKYYVNIKISLADSSRFSSNNIGVSFSTVPWTDTLYNLNNNPKINSLSVISNTSGWSDLSGSFIADSIYEYIVIGNFYSDSLTTIDTVINPPQVFLDAYYYVDEICVSTDSLTCNLNEGISKIYSNDLIHIYPNPASGKVYLRANCNCKFSYSLLNILGSRLSIETLGESSFDTTNIPTGIYILQVRFEEKVLNKKLLIAH